MVDPGASVVTKPRAVLALGLLCALPVLLAGATFAAAQTVFEGNPAPEACFDAVRARLDGLGIDPDSIKSIKIQERYNRDRIMSGPRIRNRPRKQLIGYIAWVTPKEAKGNLNMELFLNCRVQRIHTTGGYELPTG